MNKLFEKLKELNESSLRRQVRKGMIKNYDMKDGLTIGRSPQNPGESKLHSVTFDHVAEIKIGEEVYK